MKAGLSFAILALVLAMLACVNVTPTAAPPPTSTPPAPMSRDDLWVLMRGDSKSDQAWGVDVDQQGNIYTAGYYQSPATDLFFDMVIYKFAPDGSELWKTVWGGDFEEKAFVVTIDEPYAYVGGLQRTAVSLTESDMAVIKLDMNTGDVIWSFTWGQGPGYEEVDGLVVDGDYVYISGWTTTDKTSGDMGILKINKGDSSLVWAKTWGTNDFDSADGQMVVDDNYIYVSGRTEGNNILVGGKAVVVKFEKETGDYVRHQTWGGPIFNDGLGMTSDGTSLYVVGLTMGSGNGGQIFLLKYDKDLNLIWQQIWGGAEGESARSAVVDSNGDILVAGNTASYGAGKDDIALLSFGSDGRLNWSQLWGGALKDAAQGIAFYAGNIYLVGSTENNSAGQNDALLIKANARAGQMPQP
jgi:hypothetical protein